MIYFYKLVIFAFFVGCYANSSEIKILTLEEALNIARKDSNYNLQIIKAKFIQANSLFYKTLSSYLPKLTLTGNYIHNRPEAKPIKPLNQLSAQAEFNQMLVSPWLITQLTSLRKYSEAIKLQTEHAKREMLFGIAQTYYKAAASKEAIAVQKSLLLGREAHEKNALSRFKQEYVIKAELLRAQIETAKNRQDLVLAENTYKAAILALAVLLNKDADFDVTNPESLTREDIDINNIYNKRFDLRAIKLEEDIAQTRKNWGFLRYFPNISLFSQYSLSNIENIASKRKDQWAIGLNLTWNILDGGSREAEIYETNGKALEARAKRGLQELEIKRDIEIAKLDLNSADANLEQAKKQLELARENFRIIDQSLKAEVANYLEFTDASNSLATAEIAIVSQNLGVNLAVLKLKHVLGLFE